MDLCNPAGDHRSCVSTAPGTRFPRRPGTSPSRSSTRLLLHCLTYLGGPYVLCQAGGAGWLDGLPSRSMAVKRGFIWRSLAGLSGVIEAARNAFANRHTSVTCTYTF